MANGLFSIIDLKIRFAGLADAADLPATDTLLQSPTKGGVSRDPKLDTKAATAPR